jgi:hypothetical protein
VEGGGEGGREGGREGEREGGREGEREREREREGLCLCVWRGEKGEAYKTVSRRHTHTHTTHTHNTHTQRTHTHTFVASSNIITPLLQLLLLTHLEAGDSRVHSFESVDGHCP